MPERAPASTGSRPPGVSVVVPTFNRASCLRGCLAALRAQSVPPDAFEVVVVDDGSVDETAEICGRLAGEWPGLRYVAQPNRGPAAARNHGIAVATGDLVAFTDDDCVPPADWLARILHRFATQPDLIGLGGIMVTPAAEWVPLTHHSDLTRPGDGDHARFIGTNNAAYVRRDLVAAGGFDERFRHVSVEDAELFVRMRRRGPTLIDPSLWVHHPARPTPFWSAVRGYVRFYRGYVALHERYPAEFRELYRTTPIGVVARGLPWAKRIAAYRPALRRNPGRAVQFAAYLLVTRATVLGLETARRLRGGLDRGAALHATASRR